MRAREVVFVDGVRTPFGKSGPKGIYAETRADDLVVRVIRELLRRNPNLPRDRVGEVAIAATTQIGDQGLTIGRSAAILAGLPVTVPGYAIDRMCAGAMTAVTTTAGAVALGAADIAIAGGVEHMGRHPMGEQADPNPRFLSEKLVDSSALFMGMTAENLHDRFPAVTKERADAYALASQRKVAAAYAAGKIQPDLAPVAVRTRELGWGLATVDEPPRPETTRDGLASLKTPFRPHGRVTAGNSSGINDGATGCVIAAEEVAAELGLTAKMRLVDFSFAGVEPEVMGISPVPATEKLLARQNLTMDDIGLIEVNEAFAVQVLAFLDHFKIADDDPRVNPWGGAIALGHPLASSGVRLMIQLARQFAEHPEVRYGLEELAVKRQVFAEVEAVVPGTCVLATNTSSLSVSAMADGLAHPERVVGFHFFNPVAVLPLVEVVRGTATGDAALATALAVGAKLRKNCVIVADRPAFVVNRLLTRFLGEITRAVDEGTPFGVAERAADPLGLPMSPFLLLQLVGPRIALHVAQTLHAAFGERFAVSPKLRALASSGKPSVYRPDFSVDPEVLALLAGGGHPSSGAEVLSRALEGLAEEIRFMLDEGVVAAPQDIDLCMILGAGWPFHLGGITPYLDRTGIAAKVNGAPFRG